MGKTPKNKTKTGTREWATTTVNILQGCEHDCRYCYARANALRFKQITSAGQWKRPKLKPERAGRVPATRRKVEGTVMFPSSHDITPAFLDVCLETIGKILQAGNKLLIVSKPHLECIRAICEQFEEFRKQILFRFSIGATNDTILEYWEPGAPNFGERFSALCYAFNEGFATSVSCEPLLEPERVEVLVDLLEEVVTETIWIGKMNRIGSRVGGDTARSEVERIEAGQTDLRVREIYAALKDNPKIRWKDSYKEVLRLKGES